MGPRQTVSFKLQLATANVLTLFPGQQHASQFISARAESLALQFHDAGLHIVGLQETRSRHEGHVQLPHYHMISSPASQRGAGGVQLWVCKKIQDGGVSMEVCTHHLHVLHATTHRLVVRFTCDGLRLVFLVLHAPVEADDATLGAFWRATTAAIPQKYRTWRLFVLADANSRLGSVCSDAVGGWQQADENIKGHHFHQWLLEHSLFLPQTLQACHSGPGQTWSHATGATARIDYIACPQVLRDEAIETWVDERIDLSLQREDHCCVRAQVPIAFHVSTKPARKPIQPAQRDLQRPHWDMDVHTHAATLQTWLGQQVIPTSHLRKRHLTSMTVKLIQAKRFHRHCLGKLRRHRRDAVLRHIFMSWRQHRCQHDDLGPWLRECDLQEARHLAAFMDLAPRTVEAVRHDDREFYEQLAARAGEASTKGSRHLWEAIRFALPRWRAKQRSNLRCVGPTVDEKAQHYNQLEAGEPTLFEQLLRQCWLAQQDAMVEAPLSMPLDAFPTRVQIEGVCAKLQVNKASGIDAVSPQLLHDHGVTLAGDLTTLFLKIWTTNAEPWQWKGGLLHTIGKKKRSRRIEDMRGIALLDVMGKVSHAVMRSQMMPALHSVRAPLQLGGFAKQATTFATHYLRAFEQLASERKLSSCVVFLDIKSAFHAMVRELVFDLTRPLPARLREVLQLQGCDPDVVVQQVGRCQLRTHLPCGLDRLLGDAHAHTWYTLASSDEVHHTHRGSRPGSPLADAAYNALMTAVIQDLQNVMDKHQCLQRANVLLGIQPSIVAWVDDLALPMVFPMATDVDRVTSEVMIAVDDVCRSYGLILNMQPKKTEAVIAYRGSHAAAQRRECFGHRQGTISSEMKAGPLRCVPHYEHLGTMFVAEGTIAVEISHRVAKATHAHHQVNRIILMNRHLSIRTRLKLLEGLVLPVLFHGSGNWPLLSHRQMQRLQGLYMRWTRAIIGNGFWTSAMASDQRVLMRWQLPHVALRLAKMRLLYAFHFVRDCPSGIIDVVTAATTHSSSWFRALRHALVWLYTMDSSLFTWHPDHASISDILTWLTDHAERGPGFVRRLYHRALLQGHVVEQVVQAHWRLRQCFTDPSTTLTDDAANRQRGPLQFDCRLCMKAFETLNQLQVHQWIAHELITPERQMMRSTTCDACHRCFWSSQRLQQHLRYSRRHRNGCFERLTWWRAPSLRAPDIDEMLACDRFHRQPVMPVHIAATFNETVLASREEADQLWMQQWHQEGLPEVMDDAFQQHVFGALDVLLYSQRSSTLADVDHIFFQILSIAEGTDQAQLHGPLGEWALCHWILDRFWCRRFPEIDVAVFQQIDVALQQFLVDSHVGRLVCWKRRMDAAYQPEISVDGHHEAPSKMLELIPDPCTLQNALLDDVFEGDFVFPQCDKVPLCRVGNRTVLLILHLFSGRRRLGDCHWWMQHIAEKLMPDFPVMMISVDTAIDEIHGDLSGGDNFMQLLGLAKSGAVAGSLTGPPCETFSAARNIQMEEQRGPRPLRTTAQPWCLHDRTARELRQCAVGSELLMNSLQLESTVVCEGGGALMEHPEKPNDEEKVSVWGLRCHQSWCMKLPHACRHHIEQWLYGSVGVKPTALRALNLGPPVIVGEALRSGTELWRTRPRHGLKGRGSDGRFRTSHAKEYPSALCRSLVVAVLKGLKFRIDKAGVRTPVVPTAAQLQWLQHMSERSEVLAHTIFFPDYQGA